MKRVLLSFKDISKSKYIFNLISLKFSNELSVVGFSESCSETISLFLKLYPDIVFIDSKSYLELRQQPFSEYEPLYYIEDSEGLLNHVSKNISYLAIENSFKDLVYKFKSVQNVFITSKLELKATKKLQDLNFNFKQAGTQYFLEALLFVFKNKNNHVLNNMKKYVYPEISNKYHTSVDKVKWNIEKSISSMYKYNKINFPRINRGILRF